MLMLLISGAALLCFLAIAISDIRFRAFNAFLLLPIWAHIALTYGFFYWQTTALFGAILFITTAVLSLRHKRVVHLTKEFLGIGDILLLLLLSFSVPAYSFLQLLILANILGLCYALLSKHKTIPFATMISTAFGILMVLA